VITECSAYIQALREGKVPN